MIKKRSVIIQSNAAFVLLNHGSYSIIDKEDALRIGRHNWSLRRHHSGLLYAIGCINGKKTPLHRFILDLKNPTIVCDHIDGDGLNNQKENLRECSNQQNLMNRINRSAKIGTSSQFKGVCFMRKENKWQAYIRFNGKKIYLGSFYDEIEAAKAYDEKAKVLFGVFSRLNFQ